MQLGIQRQQHDPRLGCQQVLMILLFFYIRSSDICHVENYFACFLGLPVYVCNMSVGLVIENWDCITLKEFDIVED